jgi:hypothetical protein
MGPYMTSMTLGGMRIPRLPPAQTTPVDRALLYFRFIMAGTANSVMVTTVAAMTPVQAAKMVHVTIVA